MEYTKYILGYEGIYSVHIDGYVIKHLKKGDKIMTNTNIGNGYYRVGLNRNNKQKFYFIHRLVAQAFLGLDISNKNILVCHKDDNPENNSVNNLFLGTHLDNSRDMVNKSRQNTPRGDKKKNAKLTWDSVNEIRKLSGKIFQSEIAKIYGVSQPRISDIIKGKSW